MAGKKNPNLGAKLRQEREGAEDVYKRQYTTSALPGTVRLR